MIVYVAGPYRGKSRFRLIRWLQCVSNILRARAVAYRLWRLGIPALCPHTNTALFGGNQQIYLDGTLEMMLKCDAVILTDWWFLSSGTLKEIEVAQANGIPVHRTFQGLFRDKKLFPEVNHSGYGS